MLHRVIIYQHNYNNHSLAIAYQHSGAAYIYDHARE